MSISLGGATTLRFIYCAHQHDEGEPCNKECHHAPDCQKSHATPVSVSGEENKPEPTGEEEKR